MGSRPWLQHVTPFGVKVHLSILWKCTCLRRELVFKVVAIGGSRREAVTADNHADATIVA